MESAGHQRVSAYWRIWLHKYGVIWTCPPPRIGARRRLEAVKCYLRRRRKIYGRQLDFERSYRKHKPPCSQVLLSRRQRQLGAFLPLKDSPTLEMRSMKGSRNIAALQMPQLIPKSRCRRAIGKAREKTPAPKSEPCSVPLCLMT